MDANGNEIPAVNKINLVFIRHQDEENEIEGWYGLSTLNFVDNLINELKQELEGVGNGWDFSDVDNGYGGSTPHNRNFEVTVSSLQVGDPLGFTDGTPSVSYASLREHQTSGGYSFISQGAAELYTYGTLLRNTGAVVRDPDYYSWTVYVYLTAGSVDNSPGLNGSTPIIPVGQDGFGEENVPINFSCIFLGNIKSVVDIGYTNFQQQNIGRFDFTDPKASALKNWAKLLVKHEALTHGFQRKIYVVNGSPHNIHCTTSDCVGLAGQAMGITNNRVIGGQSYLELFVSAPDFSRFALRNGFSCQNHQLAGNTLSFHDGRFIQTP